MATNSNVLTFHSKKGGQSRRLVPSRLRDARIAKRLNQSELAELVGVTRQAISAFEQGVKTPEAATLALIAGVLAQQLSFFTREDRQKFGDLGTRFFRAFGPDTKRRNLMCDVYANWMTQTARYFDDLVNYPPVKLPSFNPSTPNGEYTDDEIEEAAEECRSEWGLGPGPLSNLLALAEGKGIIVSRIVLEEEQIQAFSFWNGAKP